MFFPDYEDVKKKKHEQDFEIGVIGTNIIDVFSVYMSNVDCNWVKVQIM